MNPKHAILLLAYGGPDSLDDVEPYLLDVRGGRATPPELVEEIRGRYAAIGGRSPLLEITRRQAQALEAQLNRNSPGNYRVFVGMRHWKPYIREAVDQIAREGITQVTAICMSPFFSRMSTGAYYEHLQQAIEQQPAESAWRNELNLRKIEAWYDHPDFVHTLTVNLQNGLKQFGQGAQPRKDRPVVLFTAHSLPAALADQADPYAVQFADLCQRVADDAGLQPEDWRACYQSAGARNGRWLGPSLEDSLQQLASEGKKSVLVASIGFLCDHVEVLYDIDIEARRVAVQAGIHLERTASMNDQSLFIAALAEIIQSGGRKL
ncbi:MAG: ferrochelatase [Bellilinea sp.]